MPLRNTGRRNTMRMDLLMSCCLQVCLSCGPRLVGCVLKPQYRILVCACVACSVGRTNQVVTRSEVPRRTR